MEGALQLAGAWPVLGHLARMRRDPLGTLVETSRLGGVARLHMGPRGPAYVATHPDAVKRIFLDNQPNYTKQTRGFETLRAFIGQGLLTSEGDFWRRQRRIAQPAFHHGSLRRFAESMVRAADELGDRWEERARSGTAFDVADDMMRLTLRIVGECLFSTDPSDESSTLGPPIDLLLNRFMTRITAPIAPPLSWPLPGHGEVRRAIRVLHRFTEDLIAERQRRGKGETHDLLDMLMAAEDAETGEKMSSAQLRDEVLTLLVAGHETTAAALSWAWAMLAQHPEIDDELERELSTPESASFDADTIGNATLTTRVIQETLRLHPPAWIVARAVAADDELCGVTIPARSLVITSPYATHRLPEFFPDPERFDPYRFAADGSATGGFSRYAYFPFGAGPRICIGNGFAMMEARLVLATLRRRFRLRLAPGATVEPSPQLTLRCRDGVRVVASAVRATVA